MSATGKINGLVDLFELSDLNPQESRFVEDLRKVLEDNSHIIDNPVTNSQAQVEFFKLVKDLRSNQVFAKFNIFNFLKLEEEKRHE